MSEKEAKTKAAADDPWEDLVVSILSVNQYSLEHTYRSIDGLRKQGLFDPERLMRWDQSEIVERLKLLLPVNGIGPKVIANFYSLREIPKK